MSRALWKEVDEVYRVRVIHKDGNEYILGPYGTRGAASGQASSHRPTMYTNKYVKSAEVETGKVVWDE